MEEESAEGGVSEPFFTIEEEEDVVVIWTDEQDQQIQRDIRSLSLPAQDSAGNRDKAILHYYRCVYHFLCLTNLQQLILTTSGQKYG